MSRIAVTEGAWPVFIFPFKVGRQLRHVPWVTIALILTNIVASVAFFGVMYDVVVTAAGAAPSAAEFERIILDRLGDWAFYPDWRGLYTWFTSSFLHGDIVHLGTNMFFLWLFGSVVEDAVGKGRYLALYVAGAASAAALYALMELVIPGPAKLSLGASGALAAVMAIFAARFYKAKMRFFYMIWFRPGTFETTSVAGVGLWAFGEFVYGLGELGGLGDGVAHWAHLGGLVFGIAAAVSLGFIKDASNEYLLDDIAGLTAAGAHDAAAAGYQRLAESDAENPFWRLAAASERLLANYDDEAAAQECARAMETLLRQGRKVEVLTSYEQLGHLISFSAGTLQAIGSAAEGVRQFALAEGVYRKLVAAYAGAPEAEKAAFRLPHVMLAAGKDAAALADWAEFVTAYPSSAWTPYADSRLSEGPRSTAAAPAPNLPVIEREPSAETGWTF